MRELIASIVVLCIIIYAFGLMFGQRNLLSRAARGLAGWLPRLLAKGVRVLVLFVVNTITLLYRVLCHIRTPDRIPDDFARYIERMTDAVLSPYR